MDMSISEAEFKNLKKANAILRALNFSWVELKGEDIEILIEMFSEYCDKVEKSLIKNYAETEESL